MDQGGEWETEFIAVLEQFGILSRVTGAYAPWQNSLAQRHGAILGTAWMTLIHDYKVDSRPMMKMTLTCALQAKNQTVTRRGYSAEALVFGRNSNFPDLLDDDSLDSATLGQALELEGQVAKQAEMRVAAKRSLLHHDAQQKLKNALQRKPRGVDRTYLPGEKVYFWVVGVKPTRYRRDPGVWRGPAIIVAQESPQKYFISWRGRCLLVAATNLRPSTTDEAEDTDKTAAELERVWMQKKEAEEVPRGAEEPEESKGPKWKTDGVVRRAARFGRSFLESRKMMKGLKSMKEVLKIPKVKRPYVRKQKRLEEPARLEEDEDYEPSIAPGTPASSLDRSRSRADADGSEDERFWLSVVEKQEAEAEAERMKTEDERARVMQIEEKRKQDHKRYTPEERKKRSLDDFPIRALKRGLPASSSKEDAEETVEKRFKPAVFAFVENVLLEYEIAERLRGKNEKLRKRTEVEVEKSEDRKNEWMRPEEVRQLAQVMDLPITAVRIHRQPRRVLQAPPHGKPRRRVTVMLLQNRGDAVVTQESSEEVRKHPKRRTSMSWRGLTLLVRDENKKDEKRKPKKEVAYVQIGDMMYAAPCQDMQLWEDFVRREKEVQIAAEALLLKLKASGKELDARCFNEAEAKAFRASDTAEWQSWVQNEVLQRLSPKPFGLQSTPEDGEDQQGEE